MIKKLLAALGIGTTALNASGEVFFSPYPEESQNFIYNLLFCDNIELFKKNKEGDLSYPWSVLFSDHAEASELKKIVSDPSQEGRVRMLASNRLKNQEGKELFGVIIEVGLPDGLDTLAAFSEGGARYINHSGKMIISEGMDAPFDKKIGHLLMVSKPVAEQIGPWDKDRLAPPKDGDIRLTFLVSEGLSFGQGPMNVMQGERMAAPIIQAATDLMLKMIEESNEK
jgi:hypothetical protein